MQSSKEWQGEIRAFLRDQCKETEENKRMGKTTDHFKNIRDTKGNFYAKMSSIKDRNCIALAEAEDIKKRWQEYTEELYKRDLHDPDNHDGVITHLEPDILECEVKWALRSITMNKGSGGDGIPVELFQILKDNTMKVLHSICQQIWKTQQWPQDWKRSVFIPTPKKGNAKECSNYLTIVLISHTSKVMLRILQAGRSKSFKTGFGIVSQAEVDIFLKVSCFFYDPTDVDNLISGSPPFLNPA